jgi:hypothetical protein
MYITDAHKHIELAVAGFVTGGGLVRVLHYIATQMPPLPPGSGWWTTLFYQLMKGASGHDASRNGAAK